MSDHNLKKESESPATGTVETCALEVTDCCSGPETIKLVTAPDPGLASSAQPQCRDSETDSNFCSGKDSIRLANFELDYKLGAGALGQVFHASNLPAGKEFAIKLISPDYCRADTASRRLLSALKKAAGTVSPHLAAYYDCGLRQDGSVYLVTDCLPGKTLKDLIDCSETFRPE